MKETFLTIGILLLLSGVLMLAEPAIMYGLLQENSQNTSLYISAIA